METIEKTRMIKVNEDVLIYIKNDVYLKFSKIFQFPNSPESFIGHITIWEDNAPFYFLYNRDLVKKLYVKGYNKCVFIPNSFLTGYDKKNKLYLRCVNEGANCYLKYYPIKSIDDMRNLVLLRQQGHIIHAGFAKNITGNLSYMGEAIEIIKTN